MASNIWFITGTSKGFDRIWAQADMDEPPLRIFFGDWAGGMAHEEYDKGLREWDKYQDLSAEAMGN